MNHALSNETRIVSHWRRSSLAYDRSSEGVFRRHDEIRKLRVHRRPSSVLLRIYDRRVPVDGHWHRLQAEVLGNGSLHPYADLFAVNGIVFQSPIRLVAFDQFLIRFQHHHLSIV